MKFEFNWLSGFRGDVLNVEWTTDGRWTAGAVVIGILLARPCAFDSGELKSH